MPNLLGVVAPASWPDPPQFLSVSTLLEIEACPRRWALRNAEYSDLWEGNGYPDKPSLAMLRGRVVHNALERIVKALVEAGCSSVHDTAAFDILRENGGYTQIITDTIGQELQRHMRNPRATKVLPKIREQLLATLAELRADIQSLLTLSAFERTHQRSAARKPMGPRERRPLQNGLHTEVDLLNRPMSWKGFVDLLVLSESICAIYDYKTGIEKDSDSFQILIYAWLWTDDFERNPGQRLVDSLTLIYPGGAISVDPPTIDALIELKKEVAGRSAVALRSVSNETPVARPSEDNCRYCTVRHLCTEYWQVIRGNDEVAQVRPPSCDAQIRIGSRRGPRTWDIDIECSNVPDLRGHGVIFDSKAIHDFAEGSVVRCLNAWLSQSEHDDLNDLALPTISIGHFTDVFSMPNSPPIS